MKVSGFISLFIFLLLFSYRGDSSNVTDTVRHADTSVNIERPTGYLFEKGLYKATLDISKHHISGFIFLKRTSDSSYRILFSNQMGMSFFDFEFSARAFIVHSCFPSLDRKSLLGILKTDFEILLFPFRDMKKAILVGSSDSISQFKVKVPSGKWFYEVRNDSQRIIQIRSKGKLVKKTRIIIGYQGAAISDISISNPTIGLELKMKLISQ